MTYAVWFLGPNEYGLPEGLITHTYPLHDDILFAYLPTNTKMTEEEIEVHCTIVHKYLPEWKNLNTNL